MYDLPKTDIFWRENGEIREKYLEVMRDILNVFANTNVLRSKNKV